MDVSATYRHWLAQVRMALHLLLRIPDRGAWVAEGVLGCAWPRSERALDGLVRQGVTLCINLHQRAHDPQRLARFGMRELHLPVRDFDAPSPEQLERGVRAIIAARDAGEVVAVHCGAGLGRTGTLLACYLACVDGNGAEEAIRAVRHARPGSVESTRQVAAIEQFCASAASDARPAPTRGSRG